MTPATMAGIGSASTGALEHRRQTSAHGPNAFSGLGPIATRNINPMMNSAVRIQAYVMNRDIRTYATIPKIFVNGLRIG